MRGKTLVLKRTAPLPTFQCLRREYFWKDERRVPGFIFLKTLTSQRPSGRGWLHSRLSAKTGGGHGAICAGLS